MRYTVELSSRAERDLDQAYEYIALDSRMNADRWLRRARDDIMGLSLFPLRCGRALESEELEGDVRQLLVGNYRVLFTIEGTTVRVLHVRHAQRLPAQAEELL